jgi:hypothetical protein
MEEARRKARANLIEIGNVYSKERAQVFSAHDTWVTKSAYY